MTVSVADLPAACEYQGAEGCATWAGHVVEDDGAFRDYLGGAVAERLRDAEREETFEEELQGLATTGFETEFVEDFLRVAPEARGWEVGEALAETVLEQDENREVVWPWNTARDRRTPRASLPGADLVGFCRDDDGVRLLFGEVKTSSEERSPPQVMRGMATQLVTNATRLGVQHALLRWLCVRCSTPELRDMYREAVKKYLASAGSDILIVGVLLRDTPCKERDVERRARHLAAELEAPLRVEILAWYLPVPIGDWHSAIGGAA